MQGIGDNGKKLEVSKVGTVSPIAGAITLYPKGCRPILFSLITIWRPSCLLSTCNATLSSDLFLLLRRNRPSPEWMFPLSAFRSTCHGPAVTKCAEKLERPPLRFRRFMLRRKPSTIRLCRRLQTNDSFNLGVHLFEPRIVRTRTSPQTCELRRSNWRWTRRDAVPFAVLAHQ